MAHPVRVPPLGQTSNEMLVVEWYRDVGDPVREGEPLLSVETDKVTVDVEATRSGTLLRVLASPGDTVEAGALIAWIGTAGAPIPEEPARDPGEGSAAPLTERAAAQAADPGGSGSGPLALPAVRQLAREHGIDLASLRGSGPGGRVERADVLGAVQRSGRERPDVEPYSPARLAMGRRLVESVQQTPQFSVGVVCDAAPAMATIAALRATGTRVTMTHVIVRAVAAALRLHPQYAMVHDGAGPGLRRIPDCGVGVAVAVADGVVIATVVDADRLSLSEVAEGVGAAVARVRSGTARPADRRRVSITVSNLGMHDVDVFRAIVDPDQTAILAVGSVRTVPVVRDGATAVGERMTVTLTSDHRVVDGVQAARFLSTLRRELEGPAAAQPAER